MRAGSAWLLVAVAACATTGPDVAPHVGRAPRPESSPRRTGSVVTPDRHDAALAAFRAGLMPLRATGVDIASELHPTWDGRGVLVAILDSGIDPSVAGLSLTSDGAVKLLDLRDFSGEGRVPLRVASLERDRVERDGWSLAGVTGLRQLTSAPVWMGVVPEVRFGNGGGADLNGNGTVTDTLVVVVARDDRGWFALTDTNLDGSVADEHPLRDFAQSHEWFGWSADTAVVPRTAVAINLDDSVGVPRLTLAFDVDGHGTHVAGIAAGHNLHGIAGFDGVAPGAQVLGLKIAAAGLGGVTTSGSLRAAMEYALRFAATRGMPLVMNLSFGVGNPRVGQATLDRVVDSILAAHPDVVMTVAAGNDGPGLGTIGFPASATEVLAVGATAPLVFAGLGAAAGVRDPVAHYSSRGGTRPGPDVVAPGAAWSSVPRFAAGQEERSGTSMAAPHVAGLLARLGSQLRSVGRATERPVMYQAITATARAIPFASVLDQGAGVPDLVAAQRWLGAVSSVPTLRVSSVDGTTVGAIWFDGAVLPERLGVRIVRRDRALPIRLRLRTTAPWLSVVGGAVQSLPVGGGVIELRLEPGALLTPGVRTAALLVEDDADEGAGVLARIPVTIDHAAAVDGAVPAIVAMQPGEAVHESFEADSGRALAITVETLSRDGLVLVGLHEPGGQSARDGTLMTAGYGPGRIVIPIDGEDAQRGHYQLSLVAPATVGVAARITVRQSPVRIDAARQGDSLHLTATNLSPHRIDIDLAADLVGAVVDDSLADTVARPRSLALLVPHWAHDAVLDVEMPVAQWSRLTDVGVTVRDQAGRLVAESPMTSAFGRLRFAVPPGLRGETVYVVVAPASPYAAAVVPWRVRLRAEFRLDTPLPLVGAAVARQLAPGERLRVATGAAWGDLTDAGRRPVVRVVARDGGGTRWQRELIPSLRGSGH